jgi:DNA-binding MarR family transcriptional regulator
MFLGEGLAMVDLTTVFDDLVRFQIELWNQVDARLRENLGIALGQFEGMRAIATRDGCRVYDVADELVITIGGASKLVDRIQANGFCDRQSNPDDRRSSLLTLTPAGEQMLAKAGRAVDDELQQRLGDRMPSADLDRLASTLSMLRRPSPEKTQS